jgi:hypothetical protein
VSLTLHPVYRTGCDGDGVQMSEKIAAAATEFITGPLLDVSHRSDTYGT